MNGKGRVSRTRLLGRATAVLLAACLAPALAEAEPGAPERIGPEWGHQKHQPNPAEIEARQRARGVPAAQPDRSAGEVDKLYRDLTGSDPAKAPAGGPAREQDRR